MGEKCLQQIVVTDTFDDGGKRGISRTGGRVTRAFETMELRQCRRLADVPCHSSSSSDSVIVSDA
jgi:hypothetical protein